MFLVLTLFVIAYEVVIGRFTVWELLPLTLILDLCLWIICRSTCFIFRLNRVFCVTVHRLQIELSSIVVPVPEKVTELFLITFIFFVYSITALYF